MNAPRNDSAKRHNDECHEFQSRLPELIDSGADLGRHPHLSHCAACSALVRDLEYIAAQAQLLLPQHDPGPGVWKNIESALHQPKKKTRQKK
jgi:hypothetical protein